MSVFGEDRFGMKLHAFDCQALVPHTHDFTVVRAMADRVAVLLRGEVVEEAACDELMDHPQTEYASRLLAAVPEMRVGWLETVMTQ